MILRPPRSTPLYSSAASDVYKRQVEMLCLVVRLRPWKGRSSPGRKGILPIPPLTSTDQHRCTEAQGRNDQIEWRGATLSARHGTPHVQHPDQNRRRPVRPDDGAALSIEPFANQNAG